jgi:hypothetical protein
MMLLHRRHLKISFSLKWANDEFFLEELEEKLNKRIEKLEENV